MTQTHYATPLLSSTGPSSSSCRARNGAPGQAKQAFPKRLGLHAVQLLQLRRTH